MKCKSQGAHSGSTRFDSTLVGFFGGTLAGFLAAAGSACSSWPRSLGMSGSASSFISSLIYALNLSQMPLGAALFLAFGSTTSAGSPAAFIL